MNNSNVPPRGVVSDTRRVSDTGLFGAATKSPVSDTTPWYQTPLRRHSWHPGGGA